MTPETSGPDPFAFQSGLLPATIVLPSVRFWDWATNKPPPIPALLPVIVTLISPCPPMMVNWPEKSAPYEMPPPARPAELPEKVLLLTVRLQADPFSPRRAIPPPLPAAVLSAKVL